MSWKYGITKEQHEQMFISQNNKCAICDKQFMNKSDACVDHNHISGLVRNLLCRNCNFILGYAHDNVGVLLKSAEYINKWTPSPGKEEK
jgi:hypothetical protein